MLLGYGEGGESARAGRAPAPDNVVATEFLTMEGKQFSTSRGYSIFVARLPRPLRRRRAPLLPRRRRARDAGHRLHLGRLRPPHQRRAARELGQPRQPDARRTRTATSAPCPSRARSPSSDRRCSTASRRGFDEVGEPDRTRALPRRARRGDARSPPSVNQYLSDQAPWALVEDGPRTRRHSALRRAARASTASR